MPECTTRYLLAIGGPFDGQLLPVEPNINRVELRGLQYEVVVVKCCGSQGIAEDAVLLQTGTRLGTAIQRLLSFYRP